MLRSGYPVASETLHRNWHRCCHKTLHHNFLSKERPSIGTTIAVNIAKKRTYVILYKSYANLFSNRARKILEVLQVALVGRRS